jgi:hypothetical protein
MYHHREDNPRVTKRARYNPKVKSFPAGSRAYVTGYANCTVISGVPRPDDGCIEVRYDVGTTYHVHPKKQLEEVQEEVHEEYSAIEQQMELLESDLEIIKRKEEDERRRKKLSEDQVNIIQQHLAELKAALVEIDDKQRRNEEAERQKRKRLEKERQQKEEEEHLAEEAEAKRCATEDKRVDRGNKICSVIEQSDHVHECFSDKVAALSCGGGATIMLYDYGGYSWSSGLPDKLYNKVKGRSRRLPKASYVAIGSLDRFYIRFSDGKSQWDGCDEMCEVLMKSSRNIASVAFGESWDSYAIVYTDGGYATCDVPNELSYPMQVRRKGKGDLKCISLGPDGEYYVSAKNGRKWWGGMTTSALQSISEYRDRVKFIDFSDYGEYICRYS